MTETRSLLNCAPFPQSPLHKLNPCYPIVNVGPGKFKFKSLAQDLGQIMTTLTKGVRGLESKHKFFKVRCPKLSKPLPLTPPLHCDLKRSTIIHSTETNDTLRAMENTDSKAPTQTAHIPTTRSALWKNADFSTRT